MRDLFDNEPMMALSWKEPFGSLMLPPFNKIETRSRPTKYRGLVLICTSKLPYPHNTVREMAGDIQFERVLKAFESGYLKPQYSAAIAVGRLVDCRPMQKSDEDECYVQYFSNLWCHVYEDVQPIKSMHWKGVQGWKKVPQEIKNLIEFI